MSMLNLSQFRVRWLIFLLLFALPVVRLLIRAEYGIFFPEIGIVAASFAALAVLLATLTRTLWVFHLTAVLNIALLSVNAIQVEFVPNVSPLWVVATLLAGNAVAIYLFRGKFYAIVLIFLTGGFLADIGGYAGKHLTGRAIPEVATAAKTNHVVHIIFDEAIGLGALPSDCASCIAARSQFQETLSRWNFRIYPNAFSNYGNTRDSISSLLNDRLLDRPGELISHETLRPFLNDNAYFDRYIAKQYDLRVYESDWIRFSAAKYPTIKAELYDVNSLKALHSMALSWLSRLRQIVAIYIRSDQFWWTYGGSHLPTWLTYTKRVGPLALANVWPVHILNDYSHASKNTLFFAHLLHPHHPYVYRFDVSLRNPDEWSDDWQLNIYDDQKPKYQRRYDAYCQQIQFLSHQIADFLSALKSTGHLESSTIIFHGDHGSRIRLFKLSERQGRRSENKGATSVPDHSRYDYVSEPPERDVLNRFATLLAIRKPGAAMPEIVNEKGSVLHFLRRDAFFSDRDPEEPAINSAYLFDKSGRPRQIPILQIWRS